MGSREAPVNLKGNDNDQVMLHLLLRILNMSAFDDLFQHCLDYMQLTLVSKLNCSGFSADVDKYTAKFLVLKNEGCGTI